MRKTYCPRAIMALLIAVMTVVWGGGGSGGETAQFREMLKKAQAGDPDAQNEVGVAYFNAAEGMKQDYAKAVEWFEKAAEQNNLNALTNMGVAYRNGFGVPKDEKKAFDYYLRAANLGSARGQREVGMFFKEGKGVKADAEKALVWFDKAAASGHEEAEFDAGSVHFQRYLNDNRDLASLQAAIARYRKAAEKGHRTATLNMGVFYRDGMGVEQDYAQAFAWFLKAANEGDAGAKRDIGHFYFDGKGVAPDLAQAKKWYLAAKAEGVDVEENLAKIPADIQAAPEDPIRIGARELLAAFADNPAAAASRYVGKTVRIAQNAPNNSSNSKGGAVDILMSGGGDLVLHCIIPPAKDGNTSIYSGGDMRIEGVCRGLSGKEILVEKCRYVKDDDAGAPAEVGKTAAEKEKNSPPKGKKQSIPPVPQDDLIAGDWSGRIRSINVSWEKAGSLSMRIEKTGGVYSGDITVQGEAPVTISSGRAGSARGQVVAAITPPGAGEPLTLTFDGKVVDGTWRGTFLVVDAAGDLTRAGNFVMTRDE